MMPTPVERKLLYGIHSFGSVDVVVPYGLAASGSRRDWSLGSAVSVEKTDRRKN